MSRGFSLLEMIMVIALMAIAAATVAPSATRSLSAWRDKTERDAIAGAIQRLPIIVRAKATGIDIPQGSPLPQQLVELPPDADVIATTRFVVHPSGQCEASVATLSVSGRSHVLDVAAPFCRVTWRRE